MRRAKHVSDGGIDVSWEQEPHNRARPLRSALVGAVVAVAVVAALVTMVVLERRTVASLRDERDAARSELARSGAQTEEPEASEEESFAPATKAHEQQSERPSEPAAPRREGRGCSAGNYLIGYQGPLSGDYAALGENMVNGVELAVQQANSGRLPSGASLPLDVTLELLPLDSQGDPSQAPKLAYTAATNKRVLAVVGPAFSGEALAAGAIYEEGRLPFVTPSATVPSLKRQGWSNFFRIVGDDEDQARAIAKFMTANLAVKRVAIIDDGGTYGSAIAADVAAALESKGVRVSFRKVIEPLQRDYSAVARGVRKSGVDAVFFGGYYQEAGVLRASLSRVGARKVVFVGDDGAFDNAFFDPAGSAVGKSYVAYPGIDVVNANAAFGASYFEEFGEEPGAFSVEAYMAARLIIDAVADAGCRRGALRKHLAGFSGDVVGKRTAFDKKGQIARPQFTFYAPSGSGGWLPEAVITP